MKNNIKRIIELGTLILVSTSCSFGPPIEIGPKPKAPTYIPTEQGVDKMPSKYIYKDLIEYNDYNLSCAPSIGEAKLLVIPVWFTDSKNYIDVSKKESDIIFDHIAEIINEHACGDQYEEAGWGIEQATAEPQETKQEGNSLMDDLERLGNMYEKGLLTEEEFTLAKKKLLEGE